MKFDNLSLNEGAISALARSKADFAAEKSSVKEALQKRIYGILPKKPEHFSFSVMSEDTSFAAGKARLQNIFAILYEGEKKLEFSFKAVIPNKPEKLPAFIYIDSEGTVPNKFLPSEEIADCGFAVFSFCYEDFCGNSPSFKNKASSFLGINRRKRSAPGKLMLLAYAAMRIMDFIEALDFIDKEKTAVIGHSCLAETALLAAALDGRFKYAIASCPDSSIFKDGTSAYALGSASPLPHLYAPAYSRNISDIKNCSRSALLSLISPRRLAIGFAGDSLENTHENNFSYIYPLSKFYELAAKADSERKTPFIFEDGSLCFHMRRGCEYLSRDDWHIYMSYMSRLP